MGKIDTSSNEIWKAWQSHEDFERRAYRFTADMRPLFFKWLGIDADSRVLDAGCGTGVFARYLAVGMEGGHVTGFDINEGFIAYGRQKLRELGLENKVALTVQDGYSLSFADHRFDAVTNYTYVGVLSDPEAGLRELIRVCKPGGVVSCVIATNAIPPFSWQGDYPFDGADELQRLTETESRIFSKCARAATDLRQSAKWSAPRYPKLFSECALEHIRLYPFAYTLCYSDDSLPLEDRREMLACETESEFNWLASRYRDKRDIYMEHGFGDTQFERLTDLLKAKLAYIKTNFDADQSFEWRGGFNFIVTGVKPQLRPEANAQI